MDKRKQVSIIKCEATPDGWHAEGLAANPDKKAANYKIAVDFTNPEATLLASGSTSLDVDAEKDGKWEVREKFTAPKGTLCVLGPVS
ncbi:hypothetical protein [Kitasatospora sp. NPDC088351]|uniref:hypothetical protein n=1 Tax=unclassified Kitasatospora TaxID=2633591 RepID=UPI00341E2901